MFKSSLQHTPPIETFCVTRKCWKIHHRKNVTLNSQQNLTQLPCLANRSWKLRKLVEVTRNVFNFSSSLHHFSRSSPNLTAKSCHSQGSTPQNRSSSCSLFSLQNFLVLKISTKVWKITLKISSYLVSRFLEWWYSQISLYLLIPFRQELTAASFETPFMSSFCVLNRFLLLFDFA